MDLSAESSSSQRLNPDATPNDQMSAFEHCSRVKFLRETTNVNDLSVAFGNCGPISEIHIVNREARTGLAMLMPISR